jgi:predicted dehydrogenase
MSKVTIGFIGLGDILNFHLQALQENPDFQLVSVCRRSEAELKEAAQKLSCAGYTNYQDLLATKPDVVLISLPHGIHYEVALAAFEAGCHVMVEKPMAVSVAQCNGMLQAAKQHNKILLVTELASHYPGPLLTGKKFKAGDLGRFFTGSISSFRAYFNAARPGWFLDPEMSGGGMFSNIGLHRLAITRSCLPGLEPVSVSAAVSYLPEYKIEACTSALVKYAKGGGVLYEEVGYFPKPEWLNGGIHFVFEKGFVAWDDKVWRMMNREGKTIEEPLPPFGAPYAPIYANMLRAIRGEEYGPQAWEHAQDNAIALAAYAGSREGREIDLHDPQWAITEK